MFSLEQRLGSRGLLAAIWENAGEIFGNLALRLHAVCKRMVAPLLGDLSDVAELPGENKQFCQCTA
jgi:hypothetical protein